MADRKRKLLDLGEDDAAAKREKGGLAGGPDMADPSGGVNPYTGRSYSSRY